MKEEFKKVPGKVEAQVFIDADAVRTSFLPSIVDENMWHVIIEFTDLNDYDNNYLSTEEIKEIYNIEL